MNLEHTMVLKKTGNVVPRCYAVVLDHQCYNAATTHNKTRCRKHPKKADKRAVGVIRAFQAADAPYFALLKIRLMNKNRLTAKKS